MSDCGIGEEGSKALAAALPMGLKKLVYDRNKPGDEGAEALAACIAACPELEELTLHPER